MTEHAICACRAAEAAADSAPPAGRDISVQVTGESELSEEATPTAPGKEGTAPKAESKEDPKPSAQEEKVPENKTKPGDKSKGYDESPTAD